MPVGDADRIRRYLCRRIEGARQAGEKQVTLRAGNVHRALGMSNAYANVCQVLEGKKFRSMAGVQAARYVDRPTSGRGANLTIEFHVLPRSTLDAAGAAAVLNSVTRAEHGFSRIDSRFREHLDDHSDPVFQAVVWMLGYQLVTASDQSARARYGGAFAPVVELQDGVFPPYLEDLRNREDIRVIWRELTGLVRSQAIKARLNDLLWCTDRGRDRHRHARSAIEGYLSAATPMARGEPGDEQHLDSVCGLSRALELVRQIKAPELVGRVRDRAMELLVNELQAEDAPSRPGVWMRLLDLLTSLNKDELPVGLGERLVQAHELAVARPDVRLSLFQMEERVARGQRAEIDRIQQAGAEMLISHALQQESGLSRAHWLRQALEITRGKRWALSTEAHILGEIQLSDPDSYDWQEHTSEIRVPAEIAEEFIESIVGRDCVEGALERFAFVGGSPVGDRRETERMVDERAQQFVFMNLATRDVFDEHSRLIRHAETDESKRELNILEDEANRIRWDAQFRQVALDRIGERCAVNRVSLTNFFRTELIDEEQAGAFARAFEHYWAERPDEALLIAMPRIESVFRKLLEVSGGVIYDPPRGDRPGGVRGLGSVLHDLAGLATNEMVDWWRFFRLALTESPPGLNLRNRYVHGLALEAMKQDTVVVLRICVLLRFLGRKVA